MQLIEKNVSDYSTVDISNFASRGGGGGESTLIEICHNKNETCYIVDKKVLLGIVSPGDYSRYKKNNPSSAFSLDNIMNKNYRRAIYSETTNYEKDAYDILKAKYNNIKAVPVVDAKNQLLCFMVMENEETTSISDDTKYPDFCLAAANDTYTFHTFRKNMIYKRILEHVSEVQGNAYLKFINDVNPKTLEDIQEYKNNDLYGGAEPVYYERIGAISPSTLRYVAVLADIERRFGNLNNMKICEIGIGYGGQCRILASKYKLKSYTLIDLPQVLALSKRYLNCYPLSTKLIFSTMNELDTDENYDLFISNYAFSEIKYDIQECYYLKTIARSKRGYILYNVMTHGYKHFTLEDYKARIPNLVISQDILPNNNNRLLCWEGT